MPTEYTEAFKRQVITRYEAGESINALSMEFCIALSTIYRWRKEHCSIRTPERTYTPKEFDSIQRRLNKLEHEMEIIRATGFISEVPLQKKLHKLDELHKSHSEYSVYELCEALDVARGTFYNHIFRKADTSKREAKQAQLMLKVRQIFDDNGQRFGAEKIRVILAENGIRVSKKRVTAIMQELGLRSVTTDAKKEFKKYQRYHKKNLLNRHFLAEHPDQIWVSDFTYFRVNNYWVYFCVVIDLFSRKVVGYRVSRNASTNLVTATFKDAYTKRGNPKGLTFHSDQGKKIHLLCPYTVTP